MTPCRSRLRYTIEETNTQRDIHGRTESGTAEWPCQPTAELVQARASQHT